MQTHISVRHKCGHNGYAQAAPGTDEARDAHAAAAAVNCNFCESYECNKRDQESGWPTLRGTPRQIVAASAIRRRAFDRLTKAGQPIPEHALAVRDAADWINRRIL